MSASSLSGLVFANRESIEKKQRNLLKRKAKLDQYRGNLSRGGTLQPDQAKAIQNYDSVQSNITLITEIIDNTNEFTKKIENEISRLDECIQKSTENAVLTSLSKFLSFQSFLKHLERPCVKETILHEFREEYLVVAKNVYDLLFARCSESELSFNDDPLESYVQNSTCHKKASILNKLLTRSSNDPIPLASCLDKLTQNTFNEAHDICIELMQNPHIQHAIQGKNYAKSIPEPLNDKIQINGCTNTIMPSLQIQTSSHPVERAQVDSECIESQRFNFLQPSVVESSPQNTCIQNFDVSNHTQFSSNGSSHSEDQIVFQEVEHGKLGNEPWINIIPRDEKNLNFRRSEPFKSGHSGSQRPTEKPINKGPRGPRNNAARNSGSVRAPGSHNRGLINGTKPRDSEQTRLAVH